MTFSDYTIYEYAIGKRIKVTVQGSLLPLEKIEQNLLTPHLMIWLDFLIQEEYYNESYYGSTYVKVFMSLNLNNFFMDYFASTHI